MVIAEYKLDAGIVVSSELPVLDEGESINISRCSYQGQASLLIEVLRCACNTANSRYGVRVAAKNPT